MFKVHFLTSYKGQLGLVTVSKWRELNFAPSADMVYLLDGCLELIVEGRVMFDDDAEEFIVPCCSVIGEEIGEPETIEEVCEWFRNHGWNITKIEGVTENGIV